MAVSKNLVHAFLILCFLIFFFNMHLNNLIAPVALALLLIIVNKFKKSFGMGDILVLAGLGMLLGYSQFLVLFWLGILIALLYSLGLIILRKVDLKKAKVPMIPFFAISFLITIVWGNNLFDSLLKFLGI
jgi:prepilin signal peptidase PulO-like enzyme (type II secretory pathway)